MDGHPNRRSAIRLSAAIGLAALTACAPRESQMPSGPAPAAGDGSPDRLMFIRHGEEPGKGGAAPFGVDEAGDPDPDSLSVRGWTRGGALAALFDPRGADGTPLATRPELSRPATIVAADPGKTHSKRSLQTVTAVGAALGLQIDHRFTAMQTAQVADALLALRGPALVAWKHEQISEIISRLGAVTPAPPPSWPGDRYDVIYVLTRSGDGWRFAQVPQMLLAGDRPTPIG